MPPNWQQGSQLRRKGGGLLLYGRQLLSSLLACPSGRQGKGAHSSVDLPILPMTRETLGTQDSQAEAF